MHFLFGILIFIIGMVAGICVAFPYGAVGFLIIRRFYLFGMKSGMYSAFGMALSDAFYAVIVGFGMHNILHFVKRFALYGELGLGILLIYVGIRSMQKKLELQINEEQKHPARDIVSTFLINILNPSLIFWFAIAFEILNKITGHQVSNVGIAISIVGVITGTCLLWFAIGSGIGYLRKKNRDELVHKINYYTGAILVILGIIVLFLTLVKLF
jgi:threonine/homoserine/homoserine lactone efflux protein